MSDTSERKVAALRRLGGFNGYCAMLGQPPPSQQDSIFWRQS